jgi:hypothetical protein
MSFERTSGGMLLVDAVPVTDHAGWLTVRLPADAARRSTALAVSLRLRAVRGVDGRWFVDAEEIILDGKRLGTLFEVMAAGASEWLPPAAAAVLRVLRERATTANRPQTGARPVAPAASAPPESDDADERR